MRFFINNFACRKKRRGLSASGLTLVEVMVAATLIAVGLTALIAQMISAYRIGCVNNETNKAQAHLQAALEMVIAMPFANVTATYPSGSSVAIAPADPMTNENITVAYADPAADPLQITVTINWTAFDGRQRTSSLTTLKTR